MLEILEIPVDLHLRVHEWVMESVCAVLRQRGKGVANFSPFKLRIRADRYREPDLLVLLHHSNARRFPGV